MTQHPTDYQSEYDRDVELQRAQLADQIKEALGSLGKGMQTLGNLRGDLFDVEYIDGPQASDIVRHLETAAHELRAAARIAGPLEQAVIRNLEREPGPGRPVPGPTLMNEGEYAN
ncbi:hypothetical protein ACFV9C_42475 [Kribbella sp. NPDC059898]|uniref:hypothetical protein n=1 Tax=Kribbella sp. NPDC059898 TaxID=3346995 RepID=UPI003661427F